MVLERETDKMGRKFGTEAWWRCTEMELILQCSGCMLIEMWQWIEELKRNTTKKWEEMEIK